MKANGLPEGCGLYWLKVPLKDGEQKYIYAKLHGERFSCKTSDWKEAVDFVEKQKAEWEKRENGSAIEDVLVGELLDDLIVYYEGLAQKRGDYQPKTAYIAKTQIDMEGGIRDTFAKLKVSKLRSQMYPEYRSKWEIEYAKQGKSTDQVQYTIDHHLSYLRRALRLGQQAIPPKVRADVPTPKIDKNNSKSTRDNIIALDTLDILIAALPDYLKPIFVCCYFTGMRKKEATFIHRSEVNSTERLITARAQQTKAGKARTSPIPMKYWPVIMEWEERTRREQQNAEYLFHLDGQQLKTTQIDDSFNDTCENLGWHKIVTDANGNPMRYGNGDFVYDRSAIKWHDTRRTATTTVSNLEGLTNTDILRTVGLTEETHLRYDKTQSAKKVRDAMDKQHEKPTAAVTGVDVSVPGSIDKLAKLTELRSFHEAGLIDDAEYKEEKLRLIRL